MHFSTLVAVNVPHIEEDVLENFRANVALNQLQQLKESGADSVMIKLRIGQIKSRISTFSREVFSAVEEIMEPYCESTDDPDFLEFYDETEDISERYKNETCTVIKFPNGRMVFPYDAAFSQKYTLLDGKVFQRDFGQLKHKKRSKTAKKMKVIENYPFRKLYASVSEFAEKYTGYSFYEEMNAYGYYANPNAFWDWYVLGGRWPEPFLVKEDCMEYCISEDYDYEQSSAPEGYRWVCAARKKDIQWAKMLELAQNDAKKKYSELKNRFERKSEPGILEKITEEGIVSFGDVLYLKGESLQDYLMRNHVDDSAKYPVSFYQYLSESSGYVEKIVDYKASCADRSRAEFEWDEDVASFIESLDGESVLVGVDCHI